MVADVREWLGALGLDKYAETFVENDVDLEVLPKLVEQDLKDLGLSLGHRRKALAAIEELIADSLAVDKVEAVMAPAGALPLVGGDAERRHLTVMFCDLVSSTSLSEQLDPEDLRHVIGAFQQACVDVIQTFDGFVARYMGDALLVYFGYPQAHEDDAERAVRAGLGIVAAMDLAGDNFASTSQVRVGIATGLVVAGDIIGEGASEERAVLGDTPNLAARLQSLAEPDTVVISAATQSLVDGLFDCRDLGARQVKGLSDSVTPFQVMGESVVANRFEATASRGLTGLVGREEKIGLLLKRWRQATEGDGQVLLLTGEAGVGKSRILRAFRDQVDGEARSRVLYYCSPYHQNSALYPAINQLERAARFEKSDTPDQKLDKLEAVLKGLELPIAEIAPLLANMLSLPGEERYPPLNAPPAQLRAQILDTSVAIIEAMAAQHPVLMVLEDAHWIDPTSHELLNMLVDRFRSGRIFLIITARPQFVPTWGEHAHMTTLALNRLSRRECAELVANVTEGKQLPDDVIDQIVAKTDGVPLFVEELTKTVMKSGLLKEEEGCYISDGPLPPLAIPSSLQDSLMARLDRLGTAKEVAQLAATLGRTFSHELLSAVSSLDEFSLAEALARLDSAELIYRRGVAPDVIYEFKHALVQDVAYQSLLKSTRRRHHARIAQVLEDTSSETSEIRLELLAHHYTEAGLVEQAIDYWRKSGQSAMQRSANLEAESHLRKGLALLESMPDAPEWRRREIALLNTLGVCLMPMKGFGNPEVAEVFSAAASISEQEQDKRGLFVALRGKGQYQMISGDLKSAREQTGHILELAEDLDDPGIHIEANHLGWNTLIGTGDYATARRHAEKGIALYDRERDHHLTYIYSGHDPGVCARSFNGVALRQLGYPDQARARCRDGEALAQEISHPFSIAVAYLGTSTLYSLFREMDATLEASELAVAQSSEHGFAWTKALGRIFRGGARAELGNTEEGIAEMYEGIADVRTTGAEYQLPMHYSRLGELCVKVGRLDDAEQALKVGQALSDKNEDRFSHSEYYRIKGVLLLARSAKNIAQTEAHFKEAIRIAQAQDAKLLQLRATVCLARLWGESSKRSQAHDLLLPVFDWFTKGLYMTDLKDAKALLDDLA